jgi:hypothetical protein
MITSKILNNYIQKRRNLRFVPFGTISATVLFPEHKTAAEKKHQGADQAKADYGCNAEAHIG